MENVRIHLREEVGEGAFRVIFVGAPITAGAAANGTKLCSSASNTNFVLCLNELIKCNKLQITI
jgi:hypothetical protein